MSDHYPPVTDDRTNDLWPRTALAVVKIEDGPQPLCDRCHADAWFVVDDRHVVCFDHVGEGRSC